MSDCHSEDAGANPADRTIFQAPQTKDTRSMVATHGYQVGVLGGAPFFMTGPWPDEDAAVLQAALWGCESPRLQIFRSCEHRLRR